MSELIKECNEKLDALKSKYVSKLNENGVSSKQHSNTTV